MKNKNIYPWVVVALLWVVALLNYMDRQMLSTMQEAMKIDIVDLTKAEAFGALMAVFLWIYGFMSPVAGIIADRLSRKYIAVLASGSGTNAENIIRYFREKGSARVALVLTNRQNAFVLERAKEIGRAHV